MDPEMTYVPKISIIIPLYNAEDLIKKCINSVIAQTFTDFEVLIIDDGSTDKSVCVVRDEMKRDNRILLFRQENKGSGAARNIGIENARGGYLCFVDADDYVHQQYLQLLYQSIIRESSCIASCRIQLVSESGSKLKKTPVKPLADNWKEALKNILLVIDGGSPCNKLYKSSLFDLVRFPSGHYEDVEMLVYLFAVCKPKKMSCIDKCLYFYNQRRGSKTHSVNKKIIEESIDALKKIEEILCLQNIWNEFEKCYLVLYIRRVGYTSGMIAMYSKKYKADMKYFFSIVDVNFFNASNIVSSVFVCMSYLSVTKLLLASVLCFGSVGRTIFFFIFQSILKCKSRI